MALTWEQFRKAPISSLPRSALVLPIGVSVLVHVAIVAMVVLLQIGPEPRSTRLTDAPTETVLTLAPEPAPPTPPMPAAPMPEPEPKPEPEPEPTPEPEPEAAPTVTSTDVLPDPIITDSKPPPVETTTPAPVAPARPAVTAPAAAPRVEAPPAPAPVTFAGVQGSRAKRVVYVVDASGAMTSSLKLVLQELARSVGRLEASQSFQIVVMHETQGDNAHRTQVFSYNGSAGLAAATDDAKVRAYTWLEGLAPSGRSDPLAGLTAALELKPDLVFLLTKSIRRTGTNTDWGAGKDATMARLDDLNPVDLSTGQRPTVIKAIQFIDEDPTGLLRTIGAVHGDGPDSYKLLTLEDLKRRGAQ